jgi:putative NIF3 family GTP cyclohydrolase 1 type 2
LEGTGTFFGDEGSDPKVGKKGQLETVREIRLETVVSGKAIGAVMQALRASHPYETPAFDLVRLQAPPTPGVGLGRIGRFSGTKRALVEQCKRGFGLSHLLVSGSLDGNADRVAVAAGAGASLLDDAMRSKADVLVTGELKHHDALRAAARGLTVVMTLHSNSERIALRNVAQALAPLGLPTVYSQNDKDPYAFV